MEFNEPHSIKPSLQDQIQQLEQKIVLRRHLVARNTTRIKSKLHDHLLSPPTMIAAAGLGLAFGLLLRHPTRILVAAEEIKAAAATSGQGKLDFWIAKSLKAIAIARTLTALLPKSNSVSSNSVKSQNSDKTP